MLRGLYFSSLIFVSLRLLLLVVMVSLEDVVVEVVVVMVVDVVGSGVVLFGCCCCCCCRGLSSNGLLVSRGWLASCGFSALTVARAAVPGVGLDGLAAGVVVVVAVVVDVLLMLLDAVVVVTARLVGLGVLGRRWHSVQPRRKRVTASRGKNAYVSVI